MMYFMAAPLWILISYLSGSIPFSVWLGKLALGTDIRTYGDGNPGATNVFRAGSPVLGIITLLLDVSKAALPVGICHNILGYRGWVMAAIAVAPIIGHMVSPFLKFKGGKALAAALGVWIGLTSWPIALAAVLGVIAGVIIFNSSGWAVMLSMSVIGITLLIWLQDALLLQVWITETLLLAWSHRQDLKSPPQIHHRWKQSPEKSKE